MSPRPYRMNRRRTSTEENRARIIAAARDLLARPTANARFSVEEVARRAGVARMTVYYQYGSLHGLLEALCDSLAVAGGMHRLADAFRRPDAYEALDQFISVFMEFWESDRKVLQGLGALAVLDPEFAVVLDERAGWRRKGARVVVERLVKQTGRPQAKELNDAVDLLYVLTSFSTYDSLAGPQRGTARVTRMIQQLGRRAFT
jgi:AcrR family transcriptional regulator